LFQREIDHERVENEIIPYFQDENKIKYFSPITLILLPTDNLKRNILKNIEYLLPKVNKNADYWEPETIYEREGYYKIKLLKTEDNKKVGTKDLSYINTLTNQNQSKFLNASFDINQIFFVANKLFL
jgi:hypothetical protein